eukprot:403339296
MRVDLFTFVKLIARYFQKLFLIILKSRLIQSIVTKYRQIVNHPHFWRGILVICVFMLLSMLKTFINNLTERRRKRILKKKFKDLQVDQNEKLGRQQVRIFNQRFDDQTESYFDRKVLSQIDGYEESRIGDQYQNEVDREDQLSFVRFNYDDDTYEVINSQQANDYTQQKKQQKYLKQVQSIIDSKKNEQRQNAIQFLNELNVQRKRQQFNQLSGNNNPTLKRFTSNDLDQMPRLEEKMSVDSISMKSHDSTHQTPKMVGSSNLTTRKNFAFMRNSQIDQNSSLFTNSPAKKSSQKLTFGNSKYQIEESENEDTISQESSSFKVKKDKAKNVYNNDNDSENEVFFDSLSRMNSKQNLPLDFLNQSQLSVKSPNKQESVIVDVKNINKKNDYIFFELFSAYTNQVIKE